MKHKLIKRNKQWILSGCSQHPKPGEPYVIRIDLKTPSQRNIDTIGHLLELHEHVWHSPPYSKRKNRVVE